MNCMARALLPISGLAAACSSQTGDEESACAGILLAAPEGGDSDSGSFTVAELMAHSAAMGMTQREAGTLLYLEGISPNERLEPGETLCVDGKRQ